MSLRWEEPVYVKIHEGCGGRVRWVEAIDTPGVGYTGDCTECLTDRIPTEGIIPIKTRGIRPGFAGEFDIYEAVKDVAKETLADLEWDEDASPDENQRRLRQELGEAAGVTA